MRIYLLILTGILLMLLVGCQHKSKYAPVKKVTRINAKDGAVMAFIPAGEFQMGASPESFHIPKKKEMELYSKLIQRAQPPRDVYLDAYYIYSNDVTVAQYRIFCRETRHQMPHKPKAWEWSDTDPIVNVTWDDAKAYAKWAGGDLPTEAQWEKAARGGDDRIYPWGNAWPPPTGTGNFCDMAFQREWVTTEHIAPIYPSNLLGYHDGYVYLSPVGSFNANPYGIYDMAGNVTNWCSDWFDENYYAQAPQKNPIGPYSTMQATQMKVVRGSSYLSGDRVFPGDRIPLRTEYRKAMLPTKTADNIGFRCVFVSKPR